MADKLTRHKSGITIVTEDFANSVYGGLYGKPEASGLDSEHPLVAGHVHDGQHLDGHAQKINLEDHVTGQLDGANIQDGTISSSKLDFTPGGGGIVIDPGESIGGTYENNVICLGNVNLSADLFVIGDLIVSGSLNNTDGYALSVSGDVIVNYSIVFTTSDSAVIQKDFNTGGDVICIGSFYCNPSGGNSTNINIYGSLKCSSSIDFSGKIDSGSPGAYVSVFGDVSADSINITGKENASGNSGNGGSLDVLGNVSVANTINLSGGDASASGYSAGSGGSLDVKGSVNCDSLYINGGDSAGGNAGNAGDAGSADIYGNLNIRFLELNGGICDSNSELYRSGSGGSLDVYGNIVSSESLLLNGGDRTGVLPAGGSVSPPDAGQVNCRGSLAARFIRLVGGDVNTNEPICKGGDGGTLTVGGSLNLIGGSATNVSGGDCNENDGGNGGSIEVYGFCYAITINNDGGDCNVFGSTIGSAGSCQFYSGVSISDELSMVDGNTSAGATTPTTPIELKLAGSCSFRILNVTDRSESIIYSPKNPAVVTVGSFSSKDTFNASDSPSYTASGPLTAGSNLFISDGSTPSYWYVISGTPA